MTHHVRIEVSCPDRTGLLSAVAGRLFELGANLGRTNFAVLGKQAELTCVCQVPDAVNVGDVDDALRALPALADANLEVTPYTKQQGVTERGTHRFEVHGKDRPGLVARLAEGFAEFGANVVHMDSEQIPGGEDGEYVVRFEIAVPHDRVERCLAAAVNTAEAMGLAWESRVV